MEKKFNVLDTQGKAAALSTVQIDVENAERFEINYVDKDGKKRVYYSGINWDVDEFLHDIKELADE